MSAAVLPDLLAGAVSRAGARPAVVGRDRSVTYAELDDASARLATVLRGLGVGPGARVALHLDKSIEAVAAVHGVLRAGGAYVPVDPGAPAHRCGRIIEDAEVACVVTDRARLASWGASGSGVPEAPVVVLDADRSELDAPPAGLLGASDVAEAEPDERPTGAISLDLAYVLYTSGSTGVPKGVMLTHRNALSFVEWAVRHHGLAADDVLSSVAPFHFDLSVLDLFAAPAVGAPLVLVDRTATTFPAELRSTLEGAGVTTCYAVPSLLTMLALRGGLEPGSLRQLRRILFAGEVFPTRHLRLLMSQLPHVSFHNLYGPTETNVCTSYDVPAVLGEGEQPVPIGRAIDDVELVVVTDEGEPAGTGEVGELLVRGPTVMAGYFKDAERTAHALVPHPFRRDAADPCYRTGDLVRLRSDGALDFLGRRDAQTKHRGYRIELGEVESALHSFPRVVEAVVVPVPDELVGNRLRAVVVAPGTAAKDLVAHCRRLIPSYMIPEEWVFEGRLPKTSTGKIDRACLARVAGAGDGRDGTTRAVSGDDETSENGGTT